MNLGRYVGKGRGGRSNVRVAADRNELERIRCAGFQTGYGIARRVCINSNGRRRRIALLAVDQLIAVVVAGRPSEFNRIGRNRNRLKILRSVKFAERRSGRLVRRSGRNVVAAFRRKSLECERIGSSSRESVDDKSRRVGRQQPLARHAVDAQLVAGRIGDWFPRERNFRIGKRGRR